MRIDIATLFPDMCEAVLSESIVGRARKAGHITICCHNIRDYSADKHNRVDDYAYGGGMGMVMQAQPIYDCFAAVCESIGCRPHVVYLSPQGRTLTQQKCLELTKCSNLFLLCGHYEGVDERVMFIPGEYWMSFEFFLFSLFVIACGLVFLETPSHGFCFVFRHLQSMMPTIMNKSVFHIFRIHECCVIHRDNG